MRGGVRTVSIRVCSSPWQRRDEESREVSIDGWYRFKMLQHLAGIPGAFVSSNAVSF